MSVDILKIVGLAILGIVILKVVRQSKTEFAALISLALGIFIFSLMFSQVSSLANEVMSFSSRYGINGVYITTAFKVVGISYLAGFAADICRDSGESALASKVEFAGKVLIIGVSVRILFGLVDTLISVLPV